MPSLDLNLIVVLHALLEERNVTRAGERVGLSQPGTSTALARLRRHFNDPLLERVNGQYVLTPLAQALHNQLGHTLDDLQRLLAAQPRFDPSTAERRFVIQCSDAVLEVLGPRLLASVAQTAPRVSLDFRAMNEAVVSDLLGTLREIDVLVAPRELFSPPEVPNAELYQDRWVCVTWRGNDSVSDRLTREEAARARWVMPFKHQFGASPSDAAMSALGIDRRCAVRVENFAAVGRLVVGTDLLVLSHERLVERHRGHELRELTLPSPLPSLTEVAWWHPVRQLDPGHSWFVDLLTEQAHALQRTPTEPPTAA
ncbi:LysR family transcriptional regulator [Streptomyces sp. NPDC004237]|uniref:LysR family transcriptional regulator n=1 Tax=Streptomyces sp. NPDC004237 TaxID=3154455 RepID=UPI0033B37258